MISTDLSRYVGGLRARGIGLAVSGERLILDMPENGLTAAERAELRGLKSALLEYLRANRCFSCGESCGSAFRCSPCAVVAVYANAVPRPEERAA